MNRLTIYRPEDKEPDRKPAVTETNATLGPDISVTELLMELEQSLLDADAEIKDEEESVERVA